MTRPIDINIMRRLVAGELTTTGADEKAWLALPRGFSVGALPAWPEVYGWTDAAIAYLDLLEEHERLKAELGQRMTEGVQLLGEMQDGTDLLLDLLGVAEEDEESGCPLARVERVAMAEAEAAQRTAEMERLKAELEEQRLTLLAEQGNAEGAPPGWVYEPGDEDFDEPGEWENTASGRKVWRDRTSWVWGRQIATGAYQGPKGQSDGQTARAAMLAADAST